MILPSQLNFCLFLLYHISTELTHRGRYHLTFYVGGLLVAAFGYVFITKHTNTSTISITLWHCNNINPQTTGNVNTLCIFYVNYTYNINGAKKNT